MSPDLISKFACVVIGILAIACGFPAQAIDVSGPITVDTIWGVADSPINVVASVQIRDGAQLTIDSGVEVRFLGQSALVVEQGAIRAVGNASSPVVFGSGEPVPAKGDWGPIEFQNGSNDAASILDRVVIRHGKGISITQASPTLNRVALENNLGAAITLDLASSPAGEGLSAQGNDLNGVLVPAGTIAGSVRWALVGIPYVVQQGIVAVGLPPLTMSPSTMSLRSGSQGSFTLNLAKPAPAGGLSVDVVSSVPSVASAPVTVSVPAGSVQANFNVNALAPGNTLITVSRVGLGAVTAALEVTPQISISFAQPNSVIPVGQSRTITLALGEPAPVGGSIVTLSSSNISAVTAPNQVTFPVGSTSQDVLVTGVAVGTSTLTASAPGYISATTQVEARPAYLSFGPLGVLAPGSSRNVTVNLSNPAPTGGVTLFVVSNTTSVATVSPGVIQVAAGASSATFALSGVAPGTSVLSATAFGYTAGNGTVTVAAVNLSFDPAGPATIPQATSDYFQVRLSQPAPSGGLQVTLQTPNNGVLIVTPANLEVPEGQTVATTPVEVLANELIADTVSAVAPGVADAVLTVNPELPARIQFSPDSDVLGKGLRSQMMLRRVRSSGQSYYDRDPLILTLTSSDPAKLVVPPQVTIPGGAADVAVPVTALDLSAAITVTASAPEYATPASLHISIVEPTVEFQDLDQDRGIGAIRDMFSIRLYVPGANTEQVAMADLPVALGVAERSPSAVVSGLVDANGNPLSSLTVRAGRNYASQSNGDTDFAYVGTPLEAGTYRVSAQISGHAQQLSDLQESSEGTLALQFSESSGSEQVGLGLVTQNIQIIRSRSGAPFSAADPLALTLSVSEPGKIEVPQTLVIPAGETYVELPVAGVELTTDPVSISVSALGYEPPGMTLEYSVVQADISFDCPQIPGGTQRRPLCLTWFSSWAGGVSMIDRPVSVVAVEQDPPDIVTGLFAGPTGTDPLGPLELEGGSNAVGPGPICFNTSNCPAGYIGTPDGATGSYRLAVTVPGMGEWLSDVITVSEPPPPVLSFSRQDFIVGSGLISSSVSINRTGSLINPIAIDLISSNPARVSVPASVTLAADSSQVAVPISGMGGYFSSSVIISAKVSGQASVFDTLTVYVSQPQILMDRIGGRRGVNGERKVFYVQWRVPFSTGNQVAQQTTTVNLSIVDADPAAIVPGLFADATGATERYELQIPAGESASWNGTGEVQGLYVGSPTSTGSYRVRADVAGVGEWYSAYETVVTPELRFTQGSAIVGKGLRSSAPLARWAGFGAEAAVDSLAIATSCTAASVCAAPASVLLPAGTSSVTVPVTGVQLGATRLTAAAAGPLFAEVDVRVVKPTLELISLPASLIAGQSIPFQVKLLVPGSGDSEQTAIAPVSVTLTSAAPGVASVTSSVVIPADANVSADAMVQPHASGFTTITASAPGVDPVSSEPIPVSE